MTHTPKAMPANAILTMGTDTARVPSPFSNLRAIKNSKFKSCLLLFHHTKVLFSIQFGKIKGFCFTNLHACILFGQHFLLSSYSHLQNLLPDVTYPPASVLNFQTAAYISVPTFPETLR